MDYEYPIDLDEILRVINSAEVVVFRFLIVSQRLLIDPRANDRAGPVMTLVPPARSAEERFRALRQLRPEFRQPERIIAVHWPRFIERLVSMGVWAAIEQRMMERGTPETARQVTKVLAELQRLEKRELRNAIKGEGYNTLWERRR